MSKLTTEEYKAMTDKLRKEVGNSLADDLINKTQQAFGTVENVTEFYAKGLVVFSSGAKWIYNWNKLYPRMYRVDNARGEFIIIDKV